MTIFKNKFFKNMSWMVGGKIFQMIISLFIGMFTARLLGPTNFGVIGYVGSYIAFFSALCNLGIDGIIVKEFVNHPNEQGKYLYTGIIMRVIASLISMIALFLLMYLLHNDDKTIIMVSALSSLSLLFSAFDLVTFWYQAKLESKNVVILSIIAYLIVAAFKIVILFNHCSVEWFAFANVLEVALVSLFLIASYFKNNGPKLKFSFTTAKELIGQSYHFIISGLMIVIYAQTDKIMIGQMMDFTDVGLYTVAIAICALWGFIPSAIIDSARPIIIKNKNIDENKYLQQLKMLFCTLIWLSIAYGIFVTVFAKIIVYIIYGQQYMGAIPALRVAVWYCAFSYLGGAKNIWLICENKQRYEKVFTLIGSLSNVLLNIILIPLFGIVGAALATLITQIITNIIMPAIIKDTRICTKYMLEAFLFKGVLHK